MKRKILVTGAGGYLGRHVTKTLLDRGENVIAVDVFTDKIDARAEVLNIDIFSGDDNIYEKMGCPEVCLHLAWRDGFIHNAESHMSCLSQHYVFTKHMIAGGLKHIAIMGSMHEVGYYEGAINENTPCNPRSFYGIAKDSLRRSLLLMTENKDVIVQWIRGYYIYGDDKKNNSIFAKILQASDRGDKLFPFTTGKNKYDFIRVEDLAEQIAATITQKKIVGIINCCSGKPVTLAEQVENFIKDNKLNVALDYGVFPDRAYDSPAIWGDDKKISIILNNQKSQNEYMSEDR